MKKQRYLVFMTTALAALLTSMLPAIPAWAGGIALYENGSIDAGLAAAGYAARAQDASTLFSNPAGMIRLDRSQLLAGVQPLYGKVRFRPDSNTTSVGSDGGNPIGLFPGASFFAVIDMSPDVKIGLGTFSYFGLGLEYEDNWVGRYFVQEATVLGISIMPSIAYRANEWLSLGAGLNAMYGVFQIRTAINNLTPGMQDGTLEVEDRNWGFGANVGVLAEPRKDMRIGVTYLSAVSLGYEAVPEFINLGPGLSAALQAAGLLYSRLDLSMKVPQMVMVSAFYEINDEVALLANVGWQDWSKFGKVGVSIASATPTSLTVDRNYKDTWHGAVGAQYRIDPSWLLSAGFSYDNSLVNDEDRTPDLALGSSYRFGAGAQYEFNADLVLGIAYELVWVGDLPIDVQKALAGRVSGEYRNTSLNFFNVNLIRKF